MLSPIVTVVPAACMTELLAPLFTTVDNPVKVATAAAVIGGAVYFLGLLASFFLPDPKTE